MSDGRPGAGRSSLRCGLLVVVLGIVVAGCGATAPSGPLASLATGSAPAGSTAPSFSPEPSAVPSAEESPVVPSAEPSAPPSPSEPLVVPPPDVGDAGACSGTPTQQGFFRDAAAILPFAVYCAVLPDGWFVDQGSYRLAGGGLLEISYKGPGGARFSLQEGAFCTAGASACSPHDLFVGQAAFGDQTGTYGRLGDSWVLYVDPGSSPAWAARGTGMDEAAFLRLCAALHRVGAPQPSP